MLHQYGLLAYLLPEADRAIAAGGAALLGSLGRLDAYRQAGLATPDQLTNPLLIGSLLVPLGVPLRKVAASAPRSRRAGPGEAVEPEPPRDDVDAEIAELGGHEEEEAPGTAPVGPLALPFARRDLERLRLVLLAQRRLREAHGPAGARRAVAGKGYFEEAVRWLEIHGGEEGRELAAQWRGMDAGPVERRGPRRPWPRPRRGPGRAGSGAADAARARRRPAGEPLPIEDEHGPSDRAEIRAACRACPAGSGAGEIRRTWSVADFEGSMSFVNRVAELAAAADHHPDIDIRYSKVTLALSTHDAGGLTARDFALAEAIGA
jgi:4a-hydroxytetrahydrobiopterin dehydratase